MECTSAVSERKELKDDQEMMLGHLQVTADPFSIVGGLKQCKDGRESTLADTEGSDDKFNAAKGEVERGELFYEIMFQLEIAK